MSAFPSWCPDCGHSSGVHGAECTLPTCGCDRSRDEFAIAVARPAPSVADEPVDAHVRNATDDAFTANPAPLIKAGPVDMSVGAFMEVPTAPTPQADSKESPDAGAEALVAVVATEEIIRRALRKAGIASRSLDEASSSVAAALVGYYRPGTIEEPDNHHNAAMCPYCSQGYLSPAEVEQIVDQRVREVADAFVRWAMKNEIAEPPLDWAWFGEIARRYSPLHEDHQVGGVQ